MDDTIWIAPSQQNLENILSIADDFNNLNNILVNKSKSELLVHVPGQSYQPNLSLAFGSDTIDIRPARRSESIRILGVWVNLAKERNFVVNQARDEVFNMCQSLLRKKITDKQLLYLYNMVILPRIEYRTQLTYLSEQDCHNIVIPFRKLFKQKLRMAISMPNAILENSLIYRFRDLHEVQKQSKIMNFSIQINDRSILGYITHINYNIMSGFNIHLFMNGHILTFRKNIINHI